MEAQFHADDGAAKRESDRADPIEARSVGSITGAKFGAWMEGSSVTVPAFSAAA